ncbi:MAG: hypothetical protein UU16_C0004G0022 [Candidatus Woesebacteria bacterium GW2011_GWA2_40_7]|uniref:Nucleotidyl transferase AbiEii/AbiGii toxin family protein n=3 Tax=Candidatus Woeseibacteriota TaxID=1752722 RepID=A0A0G0UY59_9BACT|nr:MAG: hypothetical protein UT17_C0002G0178 [Candidatus Woesebacteria bacterium GW2011_GWB1_39_10]KKR74198.1 MAG: hypothetical protein UU16_C0004G0022 [Candidatus Woesebacteria bacterium GW2011_GWA2_40_7]KKR92471.1 MAG: hypothetical protein UU42_C0001G0075 [Candidatus Woesebacteria bacterium GW2011_GWA1_41_13b]
MVGQNKKFSNFYLTGGTALAGYYLNHRYSEDLDFFSTEEFTFVDVANFIFSSKKELGYTTIERLKTNVNGFKLKWNNGEELIIDFVYYSFPQLGKPSYFRGVKIDSIKDIYANKVETILLRKKARDFIDLYEIAKRKKWRLKRALDLHRIKFDIKISEVELVKNLLKVNELEDFPRMKIKLDRQKMIRFFENEARKLGEKILL